MVELERASIRDFVLHQTTAFKGRDVLDYGSGMRPYEDIVLAAGGRYYGYNDAGKPGCRGSKDQGSRELLAQNNWGAILCTQVIEYFQHPLEELAWMRGALKKGGHLVMTGPTCMPEVDNWDLHRFTTAGIRWHLTLVGFRVEVCQYRAVHDMGGFKLAYGWAVRARA